MLVTLLVSNGTVWLKDEAYMNLPENKRNERGCGRERSGPSPTPPLPSPSLGYTSCHAEHLHLHLRTSSLRRKAHADCRILTMQQHASY